MSKWIFKFDLDLLLEITRASMVEVEGKIYWAKMHGFPWWPARRCSMYEELSLEKISLRHQQQVAMLFLEKKPKRAWVDESCVCEFTMDSINSDKGNILFSSRLFTTNMSYRIAVLEAIRVVLKKSGKAWTEDNPAFKMINKYEPKFPMLDATKCQAQCVFCAGTKYSGELRKCTSTDTADGRCGGVVDAHYHCTDWNTTELDEEKRWFCLSCAKSYGWVAPVLLPADPTLVPFFGVVDRYLPPSGSEQGDQLFHVVFEDGDGEEYYEAELWDVVDMYGLVKGPQHNSAYGALRRAVDCGQSIMSVPGPLKWTTQHPAIGLRVCKCFDGTLPEKHDGGHALQLFYNSVSQSEEKAAVHRVTEQAPPTLSSDGGAGSLQNSQKVVDRRSAAHLSHAGRVGAPAPERDQNARREAIKAKHYAMKRKLEQPYPTIAVGSSSDVATAAAVVSGESSSGNGSSNNSNSSTPAPAPVPSLTTTTTTATTAAHILPIKKRAIEVIDNIDIYSRQSIDTIITPAVPSAPAPVSAPTVPSTRPVPVASTATMSASTAPVASLLTVTQAPAGSVVTVTTQPTSTAARPIPPTSTTPAVRSVGTVLPIQPAQQLQPVQPARLQQERCLNSRNMQIVAFLDECLRVMTVHRDNMESARRRTLDSRNVVTQDIANQLVEDMASDLISTIGLTMGGRMV